MFVKEWKFYRYGLITEFTSTSSYPPPFNLVIGPIVYIMSLLCPEKRISIFIFNHLLTSFADREYHTQSPITILHMKIAKNRYNTLLQSDLY